MMRTAAEHSGLLMALVASHPDGAQLWRTSASFRASVEAIAAVAELAVGAAAPRAVEQDREHALAVKQAEQASPRLTWVMSEQGDEFLGLLGEDGG